MLLQIVLYHCFFLRLSNIPLCRYQIFFIHSSVNGQLGCFHSLATVIRAAINIGAHVSFRVTAHIQEWSFRSYGNSIFGFLRNLSILLSLVAVPIYMPTYSIGWFLSSHLLQNLFFVDFLLMAILTGVRWYLIVVLICISLLPILNIFSCAYWSLCVFFGETILLLIGLLIIKSNETDSWRRGKSFLLWSSSCPSLKMGRPSWQVAKFLILALPRNSLLFRIF